MGLLVVGNLLSAVAPNFDLMTTGRIIASFAHGAFFGIGALVASDLVAAEKRASAIALMFTGLTVANVVGVPLGTLLGQDVSWRLTFLLIALLGVAGLVGIAKLVPEMPKPKGVRLRQELGVLRNAQVVLAMLITVLGFGGVFAAITYIAPMMTQVAGYAEPSMTWLMVLFGLGMVTGNLASGKLTDRALMPLLYSALSALALVLALFTFTAHNKIAAAATIFLIGALGFATVPPLQKRVLDQASGAPTLASAVNIGAFNFGNALAAWLGGLVIAGGLGYAMVNLVGAAMTGSAIVLVVISSAIAKKGSHRLPSRIVAESPLSASEPLTTGRH
jgi:DHA1 family inner membrane transport protein